MCYKYITQNRNFEICHFSSSIQWPFFDIHTSFILGFSNRYMPWETSIYIVKVTTLRSSVARGPARLHVVGMDEVKFPGNHACYLVC